MAKFCGNCGSALNATAVFCGGCGTRVLTPPAATPMFTPSPLITPDPAGFAPVPAAFTPAPVGTPDPAGFAPVPAAFHPAPQPAPDPASYAPPPPPFTPAPAINSPGYAPVQAGPAPAVAPPPTQAGYAPVGSTYTPAQAPAPGAASYAPAAPYAAKKSNTVLKVVIAGVVVLFVGGALALGGLWYAAQQIKAKATQALAKSSSPAANVLGGLISGTTTNDSDNPGGFQGDPCRFLSKEEVSQAVGVTVIRAEGNNGGCSYIAKGDPADMTAKHMSSMLGGRGADAQTQKMAQKFAGAFFAQQEAGDKDLKAQAATGEIPVLGLIFTAGHAEMEMKMNRGGFQHIMAGAPPGQEGVAKTGSGDLTGIGDEAFAVGDSSLMLRKGNVMARMMYTSCPCNTNNVIPLARMLAARL